MMLEPQELIAASSMAKVSLAGKFMKVKSALS